MAVEVNQYEVAVGSAWRANMETARVSADAENATDKPGYTLVDRLMMIGCGGCVVLVATPLLSAFGIWAVNTLNKSLGN